MCAGQTNITSPVYKLAVHAIKGVFFFFGDTNFLPLSILGVKVPFRVAIYSSTLVRFTVCLLLP